MRHMLNGKEMLLVMRNANPAQIDDSKPWKKPDEVPEAADVIVFVGQLGRVKTFPVSKWDKAVDRRFMKVKGLRWDDKIGRWCSNGDLGKGKCVINV